jgi:hypothetical protein
VTATGELTDAKVAGYVAKYATKAAECTGTLDRSLTAADKLADLPVREHARRLIAECLRLGNVLALDDLRLTAWAALIYQHEARGADAAITNAIDAHVDAERSRHHDDDGPAGALVPAG